MYCGTAMCIYIYMYTLQGIYNFSTVLLELKLTNESCSQWSILNYTGKGTNSSTPPQLVNNPTSWGLLTLAARLVNICSDGVGHWHILTDMVNIRPTPYVD